MIAIERDQTISLARQLAYLKFKIDTLFDAIRHGDQKHREWLKEAIQCHFNGKELPGEN